jgi:transposase
VTPDLDAVAYAAQARRSTEKRDRAIASAVASGASLREVGKAAGMSHAGVARVVERTEKT